MNLLPDVLGKGRRGEARESQIAVAVRHAEDAVTIQEIDRWAMLQITKIDIAARAVAVETALDADLHLYDSGMEKAANDPVKEELVLRYLNDQSGANRVSIQASLR